MPRESEAFLRTWRVPETAEYLVARKYTRATLQFPDHLLSEAAKVAVSVQEYCASRDHEVQVCRCHSMRDELSIRAAIEGQL